MKTKNGVNPDFADFDEIDSDAADAFEEFDAGSLTYDQFKALVGAEAAAAYAEKFHGETGHLFDDPEDF